MIEHADIVIDLQAGDTGKGKVAHHLAQNTKYDYVMRFNGGANAGHTIFVNGQKVVTHQVPVGIFHNIPSIIGPGCVVNYPKLLEELAMLKDLGFTAPVFVDKRTHMTTDSHIAEDSTDTKIGTTKQGIGPTYRDKASRVGLRYGDSGHPNSIDTYAVLYETQKPLAILCEGAQGFQIDIDWGDYPYVTSSSCTVAAVAQNGVAPRYWRNVFGTMKAYETYSGFKTHYTEDSPVFSRIQELGGEFGATTGRKRQVRWLHLDEVLQAMYINNVTDLIISKIDILDQVGKYGVVFRGTIYEYESRELFVEFVEETIRWYYRHPLNSITWSSSPEKV